MSFEFGNTNASKLFFERNPDFLAAFQRLFNVAKKCWGAEIKLENRLQDICFGLGRTSFEDFLEITFLGVNAFGAGASKILRSLYERAVTIAYLVQNPEKVDRFVQFAAIQEHRALQATLNTVKESDVDAAMGPGNTVAEIRDRYNKYKADFKATACPQCGVTTPPSWDLDVASMVRRVGDPYDKLYVLAYTGPNFLIHATLSSASFRDAAEDWKDAETALIVSSALLISVIKSHSTLFGLRLDEDREACENDLREWQARSLTRS